MEALVQHTRPACVVATYGPITISVWRGLVNVPDLETLITVSDRVRDQYPDGYLSISVATILVKPPDDKTRKKIIEMRSNSSAPGFKGSLVVLAGDGFWASIMRSVLASLNLLGGAPDVELHVRTLAEAATLAHERIPGVDAGELLQALEKIVREAGVKV